MGQKKSVTENESRLFNVLMQAPVVFCLMEGPEHVYGLINEPGRSYFGGKDFTGLRVKDAVPEMEEQGIIKLLDDIYKKGESILLPNQLIKLRQSDDSIKEYYFDLYYEPLKDSEGKTTGILNIAVDVTEKVLSTKRLEGAVKVRDEFISIASHELRTPLTSIKLQAQMVLRTLAKGRKISVDRQRQNATQISDLVSRLDLLIEDMLDVSRMRTGKMQLKKCEVNLEQLVTGVLRRMALQFEAAGVALPVINVKEPVFGHWDPFRIEQVIRNLLTNAINYGKGKPVTVQITRTEHAVQINITDLGYGISKPDQERIFHRFERAISSSEVSGMGLGLFIAREIVDAHGGSLTVESELGMGATFKIELPLNHDA